ncbi:sensor domain-containing diguanylate cyclase [Halomonas aestuarii]|uniref:sensor domain-containing diguanylate cyclase n=1 Tax=Halomonas aestuarii TaxID=1897729 RepID=UPI001FCA4F8F|nr:sensor domain-containing diguanylate cyclase [Halomonas aestuarii]
MKKPCNPVDEESRIEILRSFDILDTPAEERFDRLTRLARRLFGVPIALVSLVDHDRQWFKSHAGLEASETPRDISFCGHAILGSDVFIVRDTLEDERFADNPLVAGGPRIRFYAGCPITDMAHHNLGTFCIIDHTPREPSAEDIAALKDLAAIAERELAMVKLATRDELTNLSNRRGFMGLAQHSLDLCTRYEMPATLVFIDLCKFKDINDAHGHQEGDLALAAFAEILGGSSRRADIIARLGGDEFVALLPNATIQTAECYIARLGETLSRYNRDADRGYEIQFTHGIVAFHAERHETIEALLAEGDALMYEEKGQDEAERA